MCRKQLILWGACCTIHSKRLVIGNTVFGVKLYGLSQTGSFIPHEGVSRASSSFLTNFQLLASALPFVSCQPFICLQSKRDQFADSLDTQSKKKVVREEWGWRGG